MEVIRVYLSPKGFKDIVCESVIIKPTLYGHEAVIMGGEYDGKIIPYVRGAKCKTKRKEN